MKKEKAILLLVIILFMILLILFVTGIGYAVQNDNILENDYSRPIGLGHTDFDVVFSGEPIYKGNGLAELEITSPRTAKFNITELEKVGDFVTVIFTLENKSKKLYADINTKITNTNTEYFDVTSRLSNKEISPENGKTDIEITVELIKLPIDKDETSSIGINISAEPIE